MQFARCAWKICNETNNFLLQALRLQNAAFFHQLQVTTSPSIVAYISIYFLGRHFFLQVGVSNCFYCAHKHFLNFKCTSGVLKYEVLHIMLLLYLKLFWDTLARCTGLEFLQLRNEVQCLMGCETELYRYI